MRRVFAAGVAGFLAVAAAALMPAAHATPAPPAFAVGLPTVVDPIRGAGEPYIAIDKAGNELVTGPAGSSTQTSWFWRTRDGGQTYSLLGPPTGHWLCPSGGGDSSVVVDKQNGDIYLIDQQGLASLATARLKGGKQPVQSRCFSTPAQSADRPFQVVLHPAGSQKAPQVVENGGRPIVYMSWACSACNPSPTAGGPGGLAYAWSDDGTHWHAADPGVPADNAVDSQFFEASNISTYLWHGSMVADPETGYVFTGLSCGSSCPDANVHNGFYVAVGKPGKNRTDPTNVGQFASLGYQKVADRLDGKSIAEVGSLFPVLTSDRAGTLYMAWVQGDGNVPASSPQQPTSWHVYYSYSMDKPDHKDWSAPIRVDAGPQSATSVLAWIAGGDAGRLAFTWLGTDKRQSPNAMDPSMFWHPFMAVTTSGNTPHPHFQQQRVGIGPTHIGDICLRGTVCGTGVPAGSRNMADFISVDIRNDGMAEAVFANDANQVHTAPTTLVRGLPLVETARQTAGPKLIGRGFMADKRFSATPRAAVEGAAMADGMKDAGAAAQLDLTGARIEWAGGKLVVHVPAANLTSLASPSSDQPNVWWMITWQFNHKIYFAKAESDAAGAPQFVAGTPASFDRAAIGYYTVPALLDYRNGTAVTGKKNGNEFVITVPPSVVGNPKTKDVLEAVTAYSILDNGRPPVIAPVGSNVPSVIDSVPGFNVLLDSLPGTPIAVPATSRAAGKVLGGRRVNTPATGGRNFAALGLFTLAAAFAMRAIHGDRKSRRAREAHYRS